MQFPLNPLGLEKESKEIMQAVNCTFGPIPSFVVLILSHP
jgi:hypothetical protein